MLLTDCMFNFSENCSISETIQEFAFNGLYV